MNEEFVRAIVKFLDKHIDLLEKDDLESLAQRIGEEEKIFDGGDGECSKDIWEFIRKELNINILGPSNLEQVPAFSFYRAQDIGSITLPPNIIGVDVYGFAESSLKEITFKGEIRDIWDGAFAGCKFLETVKFEVPIRGSSIGFALDTFEECKMLKEIQVPKDSVGKFIEPLNNVFEACYRSSKWPQLTTID